MFIKDNKDLPSNIIWIKESIGKKLLNCFPEISRRINQNGYTEIAFIDNNELRDKIKELEISC